MATKDVTPFEGDTPKSNARIIIQQRQDMDALRAWFDSPEGKANHTVGLKYAPAGTRWRKYPHQSAAQLLRSPVPPAMIADFVRPPML